MQTQRSCGREWHEFKELEKTHSGVSQSKVFRISLKFNDNMLTQIYLKEMSYRLDVGQGGEGLRMTTMF